MDMSIEVRNQGWLVFSLIYYWCVCVCVHAQAHNALCVYACMCDECVHSYMHVYSGWDRAKAGASQGSCVEVREQFWGVSSLLYCRFFRN